MANIQSSPGNLILENVEFLPCVKFRKKFADIFQKASIAPNLFSIQIPIVFFRVF